jgi:plasmid stabilization system protein ParE
MAQTVIWSEESLDDIDEIARHIARDSWYYANHMVEQFFDLGDLIPEQPKMGRIVPEINIDVIRERFLSSYRLIYEIKADHIHMLAVIHGSRLLLENIGERFPDQE